MDLEHFAPITAFQFHKGTIRTDVFLRVRRDLHLNSIPVQSLFTMRIQSTHPRGVRLHILQNAEY